MTESLRVWVLSPQALLFGCWLVFREFKAMREKPLKQQPKTKVRRMRKVPHCSERKWAPQIEPTHILRNL
eukprot:2271374-Amphidinium_carterae.1